MPTAQEAGEKWAQGMLSTPPIECPSCGRKTRAEYQCQHCKAEWTKEQLELRSEKRKIFIGSYPSNQP